MRRHQASELIQRTIATVLHTEVQDPRLSKVTITGVDLSPDFKQSTVFFKKIDTQKKSIAATESAFKKASAYFRVQLSRKTELRHTPKLSFKFDTSMINAERIANLLRGNI